MGSKIDKNLLIGTGNDGYRYKYEFKKNNKFKKAFLGFMQELGFEEEWDLYYFDKDYKLQNEEEEIPRDLTKIRDLVEHYKNKDFDVDLFFGVKNLILIIRTKNTNMLVKVANKYFKFKKE